MNTECKHSLFGIPKEKYLIMERKKLVILYQDSTEKMHRSILSHQTAGKETELPCVNVDPLRVGTWPMIDIFETRLVYYSLFGGILVQGVPYESSVPALLLPLSFTRALPSAFKHYITAAAAPRMGHSCAYTRARENARFGSTRQAAWGSAQKCARAQIWRSTAADDRGCEIAAKQGVDSSSCLPGKTKMPFTQWGKWGENGYENECSGFEWEKGFFQKSIFSLPEDVSSPI